MAMGEGIGGSGISQQRSSSEVSTRKTAGATGAASSSGMTGISAGGQEHQSGSGTHVFLASARLRSTWCELSERPVAERQPPPEKPAANNANAVDKTASAGRAASAEKPSVYEKPAVFGKADAYEKPAGAGATATEISRCSEKAGAFNNSESDRKLYKEMAPSREFNISGDKAVFSASREADSLFNVRDRLFTKTESSAAQKAEYQNITGQPSGREVDVKEYQASPQSRNATASLTPTFNRLSESSPQMAQYSLPSQNVLEGNMKASASSVFAGGLQKSNIKPSELSAGTSCKLAGASESAAKQNIFPSGLSAPAPDTVVKYSLTEAGRLFSNPAGQESSTLTGSLSPGIMRPSASLLRDTGQTAASLTSQVSSSVQNVGQTAASLTSQMSSSVRNVGQTAASLTSQMSSSVQNVAQTAASLASQVSSSVQNVGQTAASLTSQVSSSVRNVGQTAASLTSQVSSTVQNVGQTAASLTSQVSSAVRNAGQQAESTLLQSEPSMQITSLTRQEEVPLELSYLTKAVKTAPAYQPPLPPVTSALQDRASQAQTSLQQQSGKINSDAAENGRSPDINIYQAGGQADESSAGEQTRQLQQSQQLKGTTAPDRLRMQGMNAGLAAQEGDDKSMQGGSSQQKLEKMAAQSLTYGSPLAAQPLESSFNYASFAQNSVWDSLRLIWKTFLSSTEADIHELYSPPQEQYLARGEEKGQKYSASSAMMQQDAVLTLPVRAWHESDAKKQEKSAEKSPGRDGSDKGQPVPQEEKKTSARITDSEDLRDEEGDGEKGRSGGEQKDGEEKEKEGKKDKEQGKGRDGRRDEGKGKKKGGTADGEKDEAQDSDGMGSESGNEKQDEEKVSEPGVESLSSSDTDRQSETAVDRQRGPGDDRSLGLHSERISEPGAAVGPELLGVRSAEAGLGVVPGKTAAEKALEEIRSLSSAPSAKKILQAGQAGEEESAGYMPMWDIEGISGLSAASRNQRGRSLFARVSESRPMFRRRAGDLPFIYTLPAAAGPSPCFPLFAQIYSESTSPMGSHQMPPPKVHVNQDILREDLMEMLEKSVLQPIRMTMRASRFVASVIEDMIKKRFRLRDITKEYFASYVAMMMRMSGEFTFSHSLRTMDLALEIANKAMIEDQEVMEQVGLGAFLKDVGELDFLLSRLPFKEKDGISGFLASRDLRWAGVLHDIGKIRIPREVLYKPGALTDDEFRLMKMHPIYSEQILYPVTTLRFLCPVVRAHHERWDGKGYPDRLEGNSIPMAARIIAIADVFDALISDRPYKKGMPWPRVKKIMTEGRGTHFDPVLLDLFIALVSPRYEKK